MFQLFKPLTERQHIQKDLQQYQRFATCLIDERNKINGMIDANKMMIQQLEHELEKMK